MCWHSTVRELTITEGEEGGTGIVAVRATRARSHVHVEEIDLRERGMKELMAG